MPQKHREKFEELGINIDEPGNVVWRKAEVHRTKTAEHTNAWDEFFRNTPHPSKEEIMKVRDVIENYIWHNKGDVPIE